MNSKSTGILNGNQPTFSTGNESSSTYGKIGTQAKDWTFGVSSLTDDDRRQPGHSWTGSPEGNGASGRHSQQEQETVFFRFVNWSL